MKFIHAADIHLDSPLRGLERYEGAPIEEIRSAPRSAFDNLVNLAIDEKVEFVLLAGDLYDGDWKDYNTGLYFNCRSTNPRCRCFVRATRCPANRFSPGKEAGHTRSCGQLAEAC